MKKLICLLLLSLPFTGAARSSRVSALAVDSLGNAEEFVTWRIFASSDTVRPVAGSVSGADGRIEAMIADSGDYRLELVGMATLPARRSFTLTGLGDVDLGKIVLFPKTEELKGITVAAQRPIVVKEIDRIAYDVKADIDAPTSTLSEIMKKVPMVTVDDDGTIKVNGSSDFKIYRNGRPSSSFSKNAKEIFKAIPASTIKKVEVITDPGAREDAEGSSAILNIVTDSSVSVKGVTGSLSASLGTQNAVPSTNIWVQSQIDKVTFAVSGGYFNNNTRQSRYRSHSEGTYASTANTLLTDSEGSSKINGGYGNLEMSYELDTLNLFTAEAMFFIYGYKSNDYSKTLLSAADGSDIYRYSSHSYYPKSNYLDLEGSFNYQRSTRRKGETLTLSYQVSTTDQHRQEETEYYDTFNAPMAYDGIQADSKLNFIEHTGQFDWARPYGDKHVLDIGAKFIHRSNHSDNTRDYLGSDNDTYDDFVHRTSIGAAYADYRVKLGKWGMRAGLRYEYSRLSAKYRSGDKRSFGSSFNDFAPNAAINYSITDASTIKLAYNRRISRPGVYYLDPTVSTTPLVTSQGNPHLHSATFDNISLNYSLFKAKFNLDVTASYNFSNDAFGQKKTVVDQHTYYTYDNLNRERTLSFNVYTQWTPFEKTSFLLQGSVRRKYMHEVTENISFSRWEGSGYAQITQRLPWKLRLTGQVSYWTGFASSVYYYQTNPLDNMYYGFSLQRSFLKDDRLNVTLRVVQSFGPYTGKSRSYAVNSDYTSLTESHSFNRCSGGLSISYRFGSLQASVKKTASQISNDDLSGRKQ